MICSTRKNYIVMRKTELNIIVPISAIVTGRGLCNSDDYHINANFIV